MRLQKLFKSFVKDKRGYVAVIFGILALPLIGIAGAAIDYRTIGHEYTAMQTAAEAAAVAAARAKFKLDMSGGLEEGEDPDQLVRDVFNANFPNTENKVLDVVTSHDIDGTENSVTVHATGNAKTSLLQVIGFATFPISVTAKAAAIFSDKNVEVHYVFDMSPSMGVPDDGSAPPLTAGPNGSDGCFFMCHDDGTTIRDNSLTPKMDTIIKALGDTDGVTRSFTQMLGDAAAANPIPITMTFSGHYFDHNFHAGAYFTGEDYSTTITKLGELLEVQFCPMGAICSIPMGGGGHGMGWSGGGGPSFETHYRLGNDGVNGGTDITTSIKDLRAYLNSDVPLPANTRRIIVIISDGMHSRAHFPYDPAQCDGLKNNGDVYTVYIKNPESIYRNPNLSYVVPGGSQSGSQAVDTWDWTVLLNGGESPYGYYSGLNNAASLMRNCASKSGFAYEAETGTQITDAFRHMAEVIISPTIRVIH